MPDSRPPGLVRSGWEWFSAQCDATVVWAVTIARQGWRWFTGAPHARHGLAVARILLGVAILGELVSNAPTRGYSYGATWTGQFSTPTTTFVTFFPYDWIWLIAAHPAGLTALFIIASFAATALILGLCSRIAILVLLTVWVGLSQLTVFTADQSDNLIRIALTFLLFTDADVVFAVRRARPPRVRSIIRNAAHNGALIALGAQVCFIYAAGGLYKAGGQAWTQGWAIYDPLQVKQFSTWPEAAHLLTAWAPGVAVLTTVTVLVQTCFPVLLLTTWTRRLALIVVLGFHIGIGVLMGLPWFSISALALDAIFIREQTWRSITAACRSIYDRTGRPRPHDRTHPHPTAPLPSELNRKPVLAALARPRERSVVGRVVIWLQQPGGTGRTDYRTGTASVHNRGTVRDSSTFSEVPRGVLRGRFRPRRSNT
ncbi:HTTM domain-containing protein [Curtobacterium aurantiacum]|nr:HTTM domain-containing protein [Curtobacterium flaccumfaciens]MBT1547076.1 HTTM domain-containing protein [Curtobacterium flaccumfaciens pv. flaccumfaciens]MBT1681402.1 HTTM domain-containing protein [Curtobacterium flaccumfaciens pv. flaccumfaciens]